MYLVDELVVKVRHGELLKAAYGLVDVARVVVLVYDLSHLVGEFAHGQEAALVAPNVRELEEALVDVDEDAGALDGARDLLALVAAVVVVQRRPVDVALGEHLVGYGARYELADLIGRVRIVQRQVVDVAHE